MKKIIKMIAIVLMIASFGVSVGTILPISQTSQTAYAQVIKQGNRGETVKTIQRKLKNWGYYKGAVDGIFGAQTREAVKYFQRKNNLKVACNC